MQTLNELVKNVKKNQQTLKKTLLMNGDDATFVEIYSTKQSNKWKNSFDFVFNYAIERKKGNI